MHKWLRLSTKAYMISKIGMKKKGKFVIKERKCM